MEVQNRASYCQDPLLQTFVLKDNQLLCGTDRDLKIYLFSAGTSYLTFLSGGLSPEGVHGRLLKAF